MELSGYIPPIQGLKDTYKFQRHAHSYLLKSEYQELVGGGVHFDWLSTSEILWNQHHHRDLTQTVLVMRFLQLLAVLGVLGNACAQNGCGYGDLQERLGLGSTNVTLTSARPVRNWWTPTYVYVDLYLLAITDVNEKAQSFSSQIAVGLGWTNEFVSWDPKKFCGLSFMTVPRDKLWIPDTIIRESIKTEASMSTEPYIRLYASGIVSTEELYTTTSSCKMDLEKFPFDTQECTLTITTLMHDMYEVHIMPYSNASVLTINSRRNFQTQGEWELISIKNVNETESSHLTYTITIKRRPSLYVLIFFLPIFCFLVLDVASFFMTESTGEKLSFKVTLLLAISVLLLILHDILPSTADSVPLIGIYCSVIFVLTGLSILETILIGFLISRDKQADEDNWTSSKPREDMTNGTEFNQEGDTDRDGDALKSGASGGEQSSSISLLQQILNELQNADQRSSHADAEWKKGRPRRWRRVARIIDITFFIVYVISIVVFLLLISMSWFNVVLD
ncbi:5-hydroxytryptamine receptor 3A [Chanos chanos]|uniref:5-hydroxytryptamine receptor 3A n=1 Tax=Chanos chanos TaxID=29144 RepID=A0A6J2WQ12_CHACN|nr:5-hydroxytryptamine receptor 3A-like [Chanos chanos]